MSIVDEGADVLYAWELHPARLLRLFNTSRFGRTVVLLESAGSTNTVAIGAAANGALEGTLVTAERQTGGRGRKGRKWFSTIGRSLVFSIVIRPGKRFEGLTFLMSLSTAIVLEDICPGVGIKWPNDLYLEGMKIGGILTEVKGESVVIGVGIGINERVEDFPRELEGKATSLRLVAGKRFDRGVILGRIIESFEEIYGRWEVGGFSVFRGDVQNRLLYMGEEVLLENGNENFRGRVLGITAEGYLILEAEGGERVFSSGDLSLGKGC